MNPRPPHAALQDVHGVTISSAASRAPLGESITYHAAVDHSVTLPEFAHGTSITNKMSEITACGLGIGNSRVCLTS